VLLVVADRQEDYAAAQSHIEESLVLLRELGDKAGIAQSLNTLGVVAREQGDYARARMLYEESLALRTELGDRRGIAQSLANLGIVANRQGDAVRADSHFRQSLPLALAVGVERIAIAGLEGFAQIAAGQGDDARAVRLWAVAASLRDTLGTPLPPADHVMHARSTAAVRARLGDVRWASAWAEGAAMSLEQAVAYACQAPALPDPALASSPAVYPAGLSPREVDVLRLIAAGKTNREIADALFLSPGTINVHVTHILTKTNTTNRTEAAIFARDHGLA
jgi:DNA-binding NarL/FixJ family response regulator